MADPTGWYLQVWSPEGSWQRWAGAEQPSKAWKSHALALLGSASPGCWGGSVLPLILIKPMSAFFISRTGQVAEHAAGGELQPNSTGGDPGALCQFSLSRGARVLPSGI